MYQDRQHPRDQALRPLLGQIESQSAIGYDDLLRTIDVLWPTETRIAILYDGHA
jgi:hypothetical protein